MLDCDSLDAMLLNEKEHNDFASNSLGGSGEQKSDDDQQQNAPKEGQKTTSNKQSDEQVSDSGYQAAPMGGSSLLDKIDSAYADTGSGDAQLDKE